ncbi:zinc metalloprotease HtpX [Helicobacter cynogastricus]|uniref:zinc metalloprotease HtpX n=1 Tax=Helicobacter cynogastricus TaxID=329937 RepID=UPI000CF04BA4|nr:zinc metalloprotease HtpX [Helicobacter cynogastricus]
MSFDQIIASNQRKSLLVLLTYGATFVCIGLLVDLVRINAPSLGAGLARLLSFQIMPTITLIMLALALGIIFFCINNSQAIMLSGNEYKLIDPSQVLRGKERMLSEILEELLRASNTPFRPKLYVMDAPFMNAFASGWDANNSLIALTTTLIDNLNREELKAVMAHELSHILHGDIRLTMCVGILSNIMLLGANVGVWAFLGGRNEGGARMARMILLILQLVLPIFSLLLQMYLSRTREFMADSGAAHIMRNSTPMISALQKISGNYASHDFSQVESNPTRFASYIFNPAELFNTHPSIEQRIALLQRGC